MWNVTKSFFITKLTGLNLCFAGEVSSLLRSKPRSWSDAPREVPSATAQRCASFPLGFVLVVCFVSLGCNDENPQPGLAFFCTNKKLGWIGRILDGHDLYDFEIWSFWMSFGDGWRWLKWYSQNCCRWCTNDELQNSMYKQMDWIEWRFVLPGLKDTYIFFIAILDPVLVFQNGYLKSSVSVPFFWSFKGDVPAVYGHFDLWEYRSADRGTTGGTRKVITFLWGDFSMGTSGGWTPSRLHETSGGWTFSRGDQIYSPQINGKIVGPKPTFFGCPGICFFSTSMILPLKFPHGLKSGDHYNSISPSNDGKNMGMILWPLV